MSKYHPQSVMLSENQMHPWQETMGDNHSQRNLECYESKGPPEDASYKLSVTRRTHHFINRLLQRFQAMCSPQPIIGSIIALIISLVLFMNIKQVMHWTDMSDYQHYFVLGLKIAVAAQILKSASYSLLLPLFALIGGATLAHSVTKHQLLWSLHHSDFAHLAVVGLIGLIISIWAMD